MINTTKYVGIPWKHLGRNKNGIDCYGLAMLVYKEELNIKLPDYTYPVYEKEQVAFTPESFPIMNCLSSVETSSMQEYDILWLRVPWKAIVNHVGIYAGDGYFLEVNDPAGCILTKLKRRIDIIHQAFRVNQKALENLNESS